MHDEVKPVNNLYGGAMNIDDKTWVTLFSAEEIREGIKRAGEKISEDYKDKKPVVVSLLKGSFIFAADLVREIKLPLSVDFMTTSSYGFSTQSTGKVDVLSDIHTPVKRRDIILVDDIMDSGITMSFAVNHLKKKNPDSIKTCVLLDKPERRTADIQPDYKVFEIPDLFVVGYGLNFGDYYRNIPYIFSVKDDK